MISNLKIFNKHNFKFKKALGQNFLFDSNLTDKIVRHTLPLSKTVIEIGPGAGTLTKSILKYNIDQLFLIEKDESLVNILEQLYNKNNIVNIINEDALKTELWKLGNEKREIIANLPYNISTKILLNLLSYSNYFSKMTMLFQKEVALRIVAQPNENNFGRLSVISQLTTHPKILFDIPDAAFFPKPKVKSSLVQFTPYKTNKYNFNFKNMEKITQLLFSKKRKMLRTIFRKEGGTSFLKSININPNVRPENLTLDEFCKLENNLFQN